ncbi:mechanosensitive ion channel domain-containing protein [Humitalea rosea]|nr:mechanosensitive ion channel domain-containing protein [Humitalea rosea]
MAQAQDSPPSPPPVAIPAPAPAPARAGAPPRAAASQAPIGASEAARLRDLLRDDARRGDLLRTLDALAATAGSAPPAATTPATAGATAPAAAPAATPATAPAAPTAATPAPAAGLTDLLAPNTLGAQLLLGASQRLQALSDQLVSGAQAITDLPAMGAWLSDIARDPVTQARVFDASWKLALLFGLGLLAENLAKRSTQRWRDQLDAAAPEVGTAWRWLIRIRLLLGRLLLDLVALAAFAVVSYGLIGAVNPLPTTQLILLGANNAYILARAILIVARMLFSPASAHLRLVRCADETAAYVTVWLRRIITVGVVGISIAETGLLFGLPWSAYDAIVRLDLLIVSLFLIIVVLQNRLAVADALRAADLQEGETPDRSRRMLRALRNRLAEIWHIIAILYLMALWGVWAMEVRDGFERLLQVSLATVAVLGVARLADEGMRRAIGRGFRVSKDLASRYPGLEARANRYVPVLKGMVSGAITFIAFLVLLEAWGIGAFQWFRAGALGSRLLGSLIQMSFVLVLAIAVWESANAGMARYLQRLSRDAQAARSARVRTLLPMLRTTLLIVILVFVVLNVLTEIGVNVAPLLAGAGVVGLAIGFGSQKLVQDVITGVFLLFEDTVAVGDVVKLSDLSGVVEQLSIRSIRLRALDGSLHIVPFSAVTTVTNMSRDFAFAVMDVGVAYREDTDHVIEVMRAVAEEMKDDPKVGPTLRGGLDVLGVESLTNSAVIIRVRLKTGPMGRWDASREFNRRIKKRFDELGIEIPFPHQKLVFEKGAVLPFQAMTPEAMPPEAGAPAPGGPAPA